MDQPDAAREELIEDLQDLQRLNRFGWGTGLVWECVRSVVRQSPPQRDWTLLDLATGSADIPRHLVRWARRQGLDLRVTATDFHPVTLDFARRHSLDYPEIQFEPANLLSLPYDENRFDLVTCSQALHHLGSEDVVTALRQMARVARRAVVVSDLVRSGWGIALVWLVVRVGRAGRFARHDGPVSMRNGFKPRELDALATAAGLGGERRFRHRGLRVAMTWWKKL
jgi:2-polyprenyl-3-methyl-5-hydroxy-6-metoxy-1,4-benzoquinol methylase